MEDKELLACKYVDERPDHDGFYDAFIAGFDAGCKTDTEKLCRFFKFFRDNGEKFIGLSIEQFVEQFIKHDKK